MSILDGGYLVGIPFILVGVNEESVYEKRCYVKTYSHSPSKSLNFGGFGKL